MNRTHVKRERRLAAHGFTLVELMVAIGLSALILVGVSISFLQSLRIYQQEQVYNELSYNLEIATEHIRRDLRLSSVGVGLMTFYPKDSGHYTAISMPKALDLTGDGYLDRDTEGNLIWRQTVIYHVEPGSPDKLMRTTFGPRNTDATPTDIYEQLEKVAQATSDADYHAACMPGESMAAQQIFANLVEIRFLPATIQYDTYAAQSEKGSTFNWGSVVLDPGMHKVAFRIEGKNDASSGYKLGLDRFYVTRSASWREGEMYTPVQTRPAAPYYRYAITDGSVVAAEMGSTWAWSGNCELTYSGTGPGSVIEFEVYNDLWHETQFDTEGWYTSNTVVVFDHEFKATAPFIPEKVVIPDKGMAWAPIGAETNIVLADASFLTVTNNLWGTVSGYDSALARNGCWARFEFQREPDSGLIVTNAMVLGPGGTASNITFNGGQTGIEIEADGVASVWSDWVPMWETDMAANYQVRFEASSQAPANLYDLLIGKDTDGLALYPNDGTETNPDFSNATSVNPYGDPALMTGGASFPKFADIDGDGRLDLFLGRADGRITHYRNDGTRATPVWTWVTDDFAGVNLPGPAIPAFADINNNGRLDLFVGGGDGNLYFYQNTGGAWAAPDPADGGWQGIELGDPIAPEFVDINANGKLDLFIGIRKDHGYITFYENTGTPENPAMNRVVVQGWNNYGMPSSVRRPYPVFADLYGNGRPDLFVGEQDGKIKHFPHPGAAMNPAIWATVAPASAEWQNIDVGNPGGGKPHGHNAAPAFGKIHSRSSILTAWAYPEPLATLNGTNLQASIVLSGLEVGYPKISIFRSGVFDTHVESPEYERMSWTQIENWPAGDVDVRIRSSHTKEGMDGATWTEARLADDGYFQGNANNNISGLGQRRFVQFEAIFLINALGGHPHAHTNARPDAILRDVTVQWKGETGLVDLVSEFGHRPDGAIVSATINDQSPVKGVGVEMEIFKKSRTGMHSVRGVLEVRPLNTGK